MNIQDLKNSLAGINHGTDINDITNLDNLIERAGRKVIAELDPRETRRITNLTNTVHDDVYNYPLPSDVKSIVDIRQQVNRDSATNFTQFGAEFFDMKKGSWDDLIQVRHSDGTKSIRISKDISPAPTVLHALNSLTANGTVAVVGSSANLALNSLYYVSGSNSVEFDLVATGDGIQITGMTQIDLSKHDEVSELFVWVWMPDSSLVTSVTLIWGNDLTDNFWTGTAQTAQADGTSFRNGWNLLKFKWSAATETGTVDPATIDSLKVTVAGDAQSNLRVDNIISSIGQIFEIEYYSQYLFRTSGGTWGESITDDSDIINLDVDATNILMYETAVLIAQQVQGSDSASDINFFTSELYGGGRKTGLYRQYKTRYPSERIQKQSYYYQVR